MEAFHLSNRIVRVALLLVASWCVMTVTHEAGHIMGGWCCGGTLQAADLWPWHLPYSIFDPDPKPLVTLWGGPILGIGIPIGLAYIIRTNWARFIANFCVLANGSYIATAWLSGDRYLDTQRLIEFGASPITIGLYCSLTIVVGYIRFRRSCIKAWTGSPRKSDNTSNADHITTFLK